jgi:hypothetical protein
LALNLPVSGVLKGCCKSCVALLQTGTTGPIIGAARWIQAEG